VSKLGPSGAAETGDFLRSTGGRFGRQVHAGPPTTTGNYILFSLFMYLTLDSIALVFESAESNQIELNYF
jgi:hypothetical protein